MTPLFGHTRSVIRTSHALLDPAGFVASSHPSWENATVHIVIAPALGARFAQMHITLAQNGRGAGHTGDMEWFGYVVKGEGEIRIEGGTPIPLSPGSYVYVPPQTVWTLRGSTGLQLVVFEKRYSWVTDSVPPPVTGDAPQVPALPFLGDPAARLQTLLPDEPLFDLAVNLFTYDPGATLPFVETHIMEHGLVMLSGQGIYRLGDDWYPVRAGDVIWMAPYCPQWFVAMGKEPASYLYYKDVNRPVAL